MLVAVLFFTQCKNDNEKAPEQSTEVAEKNTPDTFVLNKDISEQDENQKNTPQPEPAPGFDAPDFFKGADGTVLLVRYLTNDGPKKAALTFQGETKEVILNIVSASESAKSADYKGQGIVWKAKGDAGVLIKDGKTVNFEKN